MGALAAGFRLGPYVIVCPLGAGGMGEVYRATDSRLARDVAVKVLPERLAADPDAMTRFHREARAVAALSHPNIVAIHDFGHQGAVAYVVLELLEDETLRAFLGRGSGGWRAGVEWVAAAAEAIAAREGDRPSRSQAGQSVYHVAGHTEDSRLRCGEQLRAE
jgi:hypothetical protein